SQLRRQLRAPRRREEEVRPGQRLPSEPEHQAALALARLAFPNVRVEEAFPQTDRGRRQLDELVAGDELERLLERYLTGRDEPDRIVLHRGADVRLLLLACRVDVHVVRARVLADDHALVDLGPRTDEHLASFL